MLGEPIRIAIIGEQGLFQDALASSLASQADFRLAGCFFPLEQALPLIQVARVDVLLLAMIPDRQTEAGIITGADAAGFRGSVLTIIAGTIEFEVCALLHGRSAVMLQSHPLNILYRRIRAIVDGRNATGAMLSLPGEGRKTAVSKLTPREADVLYGVFKGCSNKEIAAGLGISENTVKTFVQQLFRKTGAFSRSQLVRIAIERYWSSIKPAELERPAPLALTAKAG